MRLTTIDTHQFIKSFTNATNKEKQAEIIAKTIIEAQEAHLDQLATKGDIQDVRKEINIAMYKAVIAMGVIVALVEKFVN